MSVVVKCEEGHDAFVDCEGTLSGYRTCNKEADHAFCDSHLEEHVEDQTEELQAIAEWSLGDDTGASSRALAACILGCVNGKKTIDFPLDPDDFGRCCRLSDIVSEESLRRGLALASDLSDEWRRIADHWDELVKLYDAGDIGFNHALYNRMNEI